MAYLRHTEKCLFPLLQSAIYLTNLSHLVLEYSSFLKSMCKIKMQWDGTSCWDLIQHLKDYGYTKKLDEMHIDI